MQIGHRAAWLGEIVEFADDEVELRHFASRYRRRTQTSGLIALAGMLIPIVDLPFVWRVGPLAPTILWCLIGAICIWIGVLGLGDMATTRAHSRASLARLEIRKHHLMTQLESLRPNKSSDDSSASVQESGAVQETSS